MGKGCIILIFSKLINESILHIYIYMYMGFPGGTVVKNPPANAGDAVSIPGWERSPGERNGNPL